MISAYFGSDMCSLCGCKCRSEGGRSRAAVCSSCRADEVSAVDIAMRRLGSVQRAALSVARKCSNCNLCFEDASTFGETRAVVNKRATAAALRGMQHVVTPLANCVCIDCPVTYERHRLRETELEEVALCEAIDAL